MKDNLFLQDQRLVILTTLAEDGFYANENIVRDVLDLYGHQLSREQVRNQLLWLKDNALIQIRRLSDVDDFWIAYLTDRGLDVAQGRAVVEGVKRPRPHR